MNYLYKITNKINNKIYIGVHRANSLDNDYMGSGSALIRAIKKYGKENFNKEILEEFDSYEQALKREEEIVNEKFILRKDVYNLRTGGIGGFEHINSKPKEKRINLLSLSNKRKNGLKLGGTQNWTKESWNKVRQTGWSKLFKKGILNPNTWEDLTKEQRQKRIKNLSQKISGNKNGSYGIYFYIDPYYKGKLPSIIVLNKNHRYKEGKQPKGWIRLIEYREKQKKKNSSAYGRHWYNDSKKNYYLYPDDIRITKLNLIKKRLTNLINSA